MAIGTMKTEERERILGLVAERNPALLIGGNFSIDELIITAYLVLECELDQQYDSLGEDEILNRIDSILQVAYAGLV